MVFIRTGFTQHEVCDTLSGLSQFNAEYCEDLRKRHSTNIEKLGRITSFQSKNITDIDFRDEASRLLGLFKKMDALFIETSPVNTLKNYGSSAKGVD